jgi:hypothetical protein
MKPIIFAGVLLAALTAAPPSFASNESDQTTSDVSAIAALTVVAVPVCVTASGAYVGAGLAVGTGHQLIRLVDGGGNALSELTQDGLDLLFPLDCGEKTILLNNDFQPPFVIVNHKQIPLVVRQGYVELNERVDLKEKINVNDKTVSKDKVNPNEKVEPVKTP